MIFIRRLMPKALQMKRPPDRGFHGSLARSYGLSNKKRHCLKHTMITSMNEYNSNVYKFDWILTGEYFSRPSMFLTRSWNISIESRSLPNSRIWLLPQTWEKGIDSVRLESIEWLNPVRLESIEWLNLVRLKPIEPKFGSVSLTTQFRVCFYKHMVESGLAKVWHHARSMILGT